MAYDIDEGLQGLFERSVGIVAVAVEEIDIVEVHAAQTLVERRDEVLARAPVAVGAGPHVVASLGGDEHLVAIGTEGKVHHTAEGLLGSAVGGAVVVGKIVTGDAVVEGIVHHGLAVGDVGDASEVVPEAERERRHQDAGTSGAAILHETVVAVGVGGVDGVDHGIGRGLVYLFSALAAAVSAWRVG